MGGDLGDTRTIVLNIFAEIDPETNCWFAGLEFSGLRDKEQAIALVDCIATILGERGLDFRRAH